MGDNGLSSTIIMLSLHVESSGAMDDISMFYPLQLITIWQGSQKMALFDFRLLGAG